MQALEPGPGASIWISAAETSADMHGAKLIQALQEQAPGIHCLGMGGPQMRGQDFQALFRAEELAIVGLTEAISKLPKVLMLYKRIKQALHQERPQALVLIDAPDFHFHLAKIASKMGIPVYYYISPQVWAWRKGRVKFLQKYVRKVLCILPFEKEFFAYHGIDVEFVGHPILQQMEGAGLEEISAQQETIGLMPGSRKKEVSSLLPAFVSAARIITASRPGVRFKLIQAPGVSQGMIQELWPRDLPCEVIHFAERYPQIKSCQLVLAASGTASLECALLQVPALVAYRLSWISYLVGKLAIQVPYISIPNLVLDSAVYPELIQSAANGPDLARYALDWLQQPEEMDRVKAQLAKLQALLGSARASQTSASIILEELHKPLLDSRSLSST
ncbi:MAG: lipid-A-disaccharide synthase [Thermodesulfobacteriota bacterium]